VGNLIFEGQEYGLLETGLRIPPFNVLQKILEADLKAVFGNDIALTPTSKFGQFRDVLSERMYLQFEALLALYNSLDPELSTGQALERNSHRIGVYRKKALRSRAPVLLSGSPGTLVPKGSLVAHNSNGVQYRLVEDVVIGAGPTGLDTLGNVAQLESVEHGEFIAAAGSLSVILTPRFGWDGVSNPLDATPGRLAETDPELRIRREQTLVSGGNGKADAMNVQIGNLATVTAVTYFENTTDQADGRGQAAHSLEFFVIGGTEAEIAALLWLKRGTFVNFQGNTSVTVNDSEGYPQTVRFSRPLLVEIWVIAEIQTGPSYPAGGDDLIKANLLARGSALGIGDDVVVDPYLKGALADIPGILGVTLKVGTAPSPTQSANIPIDITGIAVFATPRITVAHV